MTIRLLAIASKSRVHSFWNSSSNFFKKRLKKAEISAFFSKSQLVLPCTHVSYKDTLEMKTNRSNSKECQAGKKGSDTQPKVPL